MKALQFELGKVENPAIVDQLRGDLEEVKPMAAVFDRQYVKRLDGLFPWEYLGKPLKEILRPLEMTEDEFIRVCDKFTNKKIFKRDVSGALLKDRDGNLTKLNHDNV